MVSVARIILIIGIPRIVRVTPGIVRVTIVPVTWIAITRVLKIVAHVRVIWVTPIGRAPLSYSRDGNRGRSRRATC